MKVTFEMSEKELRLAIDAINNYLESATTPVTACDYTITEDEELEFKEFDNEYSLYKVGYELYSTVMKQTEDEEYINYHKELNQF